MDKKEWEEFWGITEEEGIVEEEVLLLGISLILN